MVAMTYIVEARRVGKWWAITAPGIRGVHSQARRLNEVEAMAGEAIAGVLDLPEHSFNVDVRVVLPPELKQVVTRTKTLRNAATKAQEAASSEMRAAARELVYNQGLTTREASQLLEVSQQRVAQLAGARNR
jgi:predicted RNase H-like HicB family nuclease